MGQIDKIYLKERGFKKLIRIVIGCMCTGLFYYGLWGPYSNMSIEWHYPVSYKFNMAACTLMAVTDAVLVAVNTLVFTEELGGAEVWYKLDLYLCCKMGSGLYAVVTFLAMAHFGWPSLNYSSSIDPWMVLATGLSLTNTISYWMELRQVKKKGAPSQTGDQLQSSDDRARLVDVGIQYWEHDFVDQERKTDMYSMDEKDDIIADKVDIENDKSKSRDVDHVEDTQRNKDLIDLATSVPTETVDT